MSRRQRLCGPKPTPGGEEAGTTSTCRAARRTDRADRLAHAQEAPAHRPVTPRRSLPKTHVCPLSLSYDSLCLTTSVKKTTPPSLLQNATIHPDPRFTTPSTFPLFADFPPMVRWVPVRVFRKHPAPELTSIKTSTARFGTAGPQKCDASAPRSAPPRPISGDPHNFLWPPLSCPLTTTHWSVSHRSPVLRGVSAGV